MLFKMSVKNIRRSFKDYTIYFFTLILGVAVFYVFNALGSQTVMLKLSNTMYEILELMNRILSGVSVFVSCILGALILYASRFLIKRRKKEFGIYLTLGMSKYKISRILFMETLLIGLLSLAVNMASLMNIPVYGIVENMSYALCPDCGKKIFVFGESKVEETATKHKVPVLAQIPIQPELASACDNGQVESLDASFMDNACRILEREDA